jgi:NAD(P)H-dependent FMN reductase
VPEGVSCRLFDRLANLPAFNPDDDREPLPPEVDQFRQAIHSADAILFCTPEYAGALPGSLKNLLDWTIGDDLAGSIYEKPVCWINVSPRGATGAHRELRTVLGYAHARIVEEACVDVPISPSMVNADGLIEDPESLGLIAGAMVALSCAALAEATQPTGSSQATG